MKIKIKIIITAILAVLCIVPAIAVFASENDFSVKESDGFVIAYPSSDLSEAASIMGIKEKELKTLCRDNDVLFLAVNEDNSVQVRLSRYQTALSKKAEDISALSDTLLGDFIGVSDGEYIKEKINSTTFLRVDETLVDDGGKYTSRQYLTIKNGYVYQISVYIGDSADPKTADDFIDGIRIIGATIYSPKQKILVGLAISAFLILIIIMIRGIIKDIKEK